MYLLGLDLGTSFIKISVVDAQRQQIVFQGQYPEQEMKICSPQKGWAEQNPEDWWEAIQQLILMAGRSKKYNSLDIGAIGIAYQMHGLVIVDQEFSVIRPAILWCDGRAIEAGEKLSAQLGEKYCEENLHNAPGNFTASKLAWIKEHEPEHYERIQYCMLPGDFIGLRLTNRCTTTPSALSEGIFWDFKTQSLSGEILSASGMSPALFPEVQSVFSDHGRLSRLISQKLHLTEGIPVTYKAGDQFNNAFSLGVLHKGEAAATAGTSGVIFQVDTEFKRDPYSRINTFLHINATKDRPVLGNLLCINGTGIVYQWMKSLFMDGVSYEQMNEEASRCPAGSHGLYVFPFGNGPERIFKNKLVGASVHQINLTTHTRGHMFRACQEGIAYAFRFGLDIMKESGISIGTIKSHQANLFLSPLFQKTFVQVTDLPLHVMKGEGSSGAAFGAGLGLGVYHSCEEATRPLRAQQVIRPEPVGLYEDHYQQWKSALLTQLSN